jgi:predicted XRE-type DNA-binding protein
MTDETVTHGSGDVFADLGFPVAHGLKAGLVSRLQRAVRERGLTQTQAAEVVGLTQADLSRLFSGKFSNVSVERLMNALAKLDLDIDVTVRRKGEAAGETIHFAPVHS